MNNHDKKLLNNVESLKDGVSTKEREEFYNNYVQELQEAVKEGRNHELLSALNLDLTEEVNLSNQKRFLDAIASPRNDVVKLMLDLGIECIVPQNASEAYKATSVDMAIVYRNSDALKLILDKRMSELG